MVFGGPERCLFHPPCASGLKVPLQMARQGLPGKPPSAQNEWGELARHLPPHPHSLVCEAGGTNTFLWATVLSSFGLTRTRVGGAGAALAGSCIRPVFQQGGDRGTLTERWGTVCAGERLELRSC